MLFLLFLLLLAVEAEEVWEEPAPSHCIRQNQFIWSRHIWGQNNALNVNETLSYHRLASSSGGLFGTSGFSTAISIIMYDLESAYIWDNNKSLWKKVNIIPFQEYFHISLLYYDWQVNWPVPPRSPVAPVQTHCQSEHIFPGNPAVERWHQLDPHLFTWKLIYFENSIKSVVLSYDRDLWVIMSLG